MKINMIMRCWPGLLLAFGTYLSCCGQDGFIDGEPNLAYWQIGYQKPIVIVLHGGPAVQHDYLRPEFDALQKVATVIYYDQRGCGKSQPVATYLWQDHISDLKRIIQFFSKEKPVFLAGSSWGSTLAMIYTYIYPDDVKGLILSGTYPWEGVNSIYRRTLRYKRYPPFKSRIVEQRSYIDEEIEGQFYGKTGPNYQGD